MTAASSAPPPPEQTAGEGGEAAAAPAEAADMEVAAAAAASARAAAPAGAAERAAPAAAPRRGGTRKTRQSSRQTRKIRTSVMVGGAPGDYKINWFELEGYNTGKELTVDLFDWNNMISPYGYSIKRGVMNNIGWLCGAFKTAGTNVYVKNLLFAAVFNADTIDVNISDKKGWVDHFPTIFLEAYEKESKNITNYTSKFQAYEKATIRVRPVNSQINVKTVFSNPPCKNTNFVSFFMDPSFISYGIKEYKSTYVALTGEMLDDYNRDRAAFERKLLEDGYKKKGDKK
jgi:hypothetical protein